MDRLITQLGQSRAIITFIILIGAIIGYLNYSQSDENVVIIQAPTSNRRGSIEAFANFKIDFSILENETYKSLELFGENPVQPGYTGEKRDPFAPI